MALDPVHEILCLAESEAQSFGHGIVGTIHVLLSLIRKEVFTVKQICKRYNFSLDSLKAWIEKKTASKSVFIEADGGVVKRLQRKVSELAKGKAHVTEIFLVLALLQETESYAVQALRDLGVDVEREAFHLEWAIG